MTAETASTTGTARLRRNVLDLPQVVAWARIGRRREFMADQLGIRLKPEVMPLSNLAGYLPPYWLAPGLAMRKK